MGHHPILAIDHGQARIGLAATDELGIASHPVETIHTSRVDPLQRIAEIVEERRIRLILLGLPLRLDGREGEAAHRVRAFGTELAGKIPGVPLAAIAKFAAPLRSPSIDLHRLQVARGRAGYRRREIT